MKIWLATAAATLAFGPGANASRLATKDRREQLPSLSVMHDGSAVVMSNGEGRFYDALTLAKIGDEWKTLSKVFVRQDQ